MLFNSAFTKAKEINPQESMNDGYQASLPYSSLRSNHDEELSIGIEKNLNLGCRLENTFYAPQLGD